MSITLELSDDLVVQLQRLSKVTGKSIEELVARGIEAQLTQAVPSADEIDRLGLTKLMAYAGCFATEPKNSGDNWKIDEDLADAYAGRDVPG